MELRTPPLSDGVLAVPAGKLALAVTFLEMRARPALRSVAKPMEFLRFGAGDLDVHRALFRRVGENWLWWSRLTMPDKALAVILGHADVESYAVRAGGNEIGFLELDFRENGECNLAFFGLVPEAIGSGYGRALMTDAIARAWAKPISRFWVYTCSLDHPDALSFYRRSGFVPYARAVELADDPRATGVLPRSAAQQVPLIELPS